MFGVACLLGLREGFDKTFPFPQWKRESLLYYDSANRPVRALSGISHPRLCKN